MKPIVKVTGNLMAASSNSIATAQSLASAGNLDLDGSIVSNGVAVIDPPAILSVTSNGNDSATEFVITGTGIYGEALTETRTGPNNSSINTVNVFSTVSSIYANSATVGGVSVGNAEISQTQMVSLDTWASTPIAIQCSKIGTENITYSLEFSSDNPNDPVNPVPRSQMVWLSSGDSNFNTASTSNIGYFYNVPLYLRLVYEGTGGIRMTVLQYGSVFK